MTSSIPAVPVSDPLHRFQVAGAALCIVGAVMSVVGWFVSPQSFYSAWLTAYFYWLGISLGCLGWTMIHGMTGGRWGLLVRRIQRVATCTMPLIVLLFLPICFGVGQIYEWANPEFVQHHPAMVRKAGYLNIKGFEIRAVVYFALWIGMTWLLSRMPFQFDATTDGRRANQWQRYSGMMFIVYGFSMTLAAVDWMMSLEPEWYSTMYGLIHISGQGVSSLAFAIVILNALQKTAFAPITIDAARLNDLGNLLLAAVMFWAYCSFFQFLVIWCGNLPEENSWYLHRNQGGWRYLIYTLLFLEFILPFLLLLVRQQKRSLRDLSRIAGCLLVMRFFELYWLAVPGFSHRDSGLINYGIDLAAFAAVSGAWIVSFCWQLKNNKLLLAPNGN